MKTVFNNVVRWDVIGGLLALSLASVGGWSTSVFAQAPDASDAGAPDDETGEVAEETPETEPEPSEDESDPDDDLFTIESEEELDELNQEEPVEPAASDVEADAADAEFEFELNTLVVTAGRHEELLADAPIATEVIGREELEASGAESLGEVLEEHAGVDVQRTERGDGVRIQGLDFDHVLILVDGERVIGRIGGIVDLSRYTLDDVERIEIVRGAASALYGSDAIGGVINIITRRSEEPFQIVGRMTYGYIDPFQPAGRQFFDDSGHTFDLSAATGFSTDDWNVHFAAGFHRSDAYDLFPDDVATDGAGYNEFSASNRTTYRFSQRLKLTGRVEYRRRDSDAIDALATGAVFDRDQIQEEVAISLRPDLLVGDDHRLSLRGYFTLFRDQLLQDQRGSDAEDQFQDQTQQLGQYTFQYDWFPSDEHLLTVGLESAFEVLESPRLNTTGRRGRISPYAQHEWTLVEEPYLVVVPGLRFDADTQFGAHLSPKLAIRFDPHEKVILRASMGHGFRAPNFRELLLSFNNRSGGYLLSGNPDLGPESAWSFNLGVEYRAARWLWLSLNLYRNQIDGLIDIETSPAVGPLLRFDYANIASAHTQGAELSVRLRPVRGLRVDLGYTLTDTEDETLERALEGRAPHRGTFKVQYKHAASGLTSMVRGSIVSERPFYVDSDGDDVDETIEDDPYVTLDTRVQLELGEHVRVFLGLDNLLNVGGELLNVQPRTLYGGVSGRYD